MIIRAESESDYKHIRTINLKVFPSSAEADLIEKLRCKDIDIISLVAAQGEQLVGHILFSPVTLENDHSGLRIIGLGPMAVLPSWQNKGIGSKLVNSGLQQCINQGYDAVVVLGHPEYYPRFGFRSSKTFGIKSEYDVPDDAFMVKELKKGILNGKHGTIRYHPLFNEL
jgi:putative acetyltransferase